MYFKNNIPQRLAWRRHGDSVRRQNRTFCSQLSSTEVPADHSNHLQTMCSNSRMQIYHSFIHFNHSIYCLLTFCVNLCLICRHKPLKACYHYYYYCWQNVLNASEIFLSMCYINLHFTFLLIYCCGNGYTHTHENFYPTQPDPWHRPMHVNMCTKYHLKTAKKPTLCPNIKWTPRILRTNHK